MSDMGCHLKPGGIITDIINHLLLPVNLLILATMATGCKLHPGFRNCLVKILHHSSLGRIRGVMLLKLEKLDP